MVFKPDDWVWLHMLKEQFLVQCHNKLLSCGDGPFQVLERINDSAYELELPGEYGVSTTFNIFYLCPFDSNNALDLKTKPSQDEGNDRKIGDVRDQVLRCVGASRVMIKFLL